MLLILLIGAYVAPFCWMIPARKLAKRAHSATPFFRSVGICFLLTSLAVLRNLQVFPKEELNKAIVTVMFLLVVPLWLLWQRREIASWFPLPENCSGKKRIQSGSGSKLANADLVRCLLVGVGADVLWSERILLVLSGMDPSKPASVARMKPEKSGPNIALHPTRACERLHFFGLPCGARSGELTRWRHISVWGQVLTGCCSKGRYQLRCITTAKTDTKPTRSWLPKESSNFYAF